MNKLKTIEDININLEELIYNFQPELTIKLDWLNWDFDQDIINEIVLWKVNRYAWVKDETLYLLNNIDKASENIDLNLTKNILVELLNTKWIKLAMASTILRFKNPNIYQIIDQRVYRIIFGKDLKTTTLKTDQAVELYLNYLIKLNEVCVKYDIKFSDSDRVLYALDKSINKEIKIKY